MGSTQKYTRWSGSQASEKGQKDMGSDPGSAPMESLSVLEYPEKFQRQQWRVWKAGVCRTMLTKLSMEEPGEVSV